MKYAIFQSIFLLLFSASILSAQPNKKVMPALAKFLNTEFMLKFRDLRIEAESAALGVQARKDELKSADLMRLRSAYDQTASRANNLLENIKQDFLNPKKLKSIAEFPEMYSDGLRYKLQELSDFYAANFQQVLADAQVKNVDGSAILLLVVELISLSKGLTDYFAAIKRESRQYTETYLQENFIQPYRWRYWDEIAGSVSPYEKFDKTQTILNDPSTQGQDILDKQIQRIGEKAGTLDFKTGGGNNDDGFKIPSDDHSAQGTDFQYDNWKPDTTNTAVDTIGQRDVKPALPQKQGPALQPGRGAANAPAPAPKITPKTTPSAIKQENE